MVFAPGSVVAGRYEIAHELGSGGMARVYLAHDRVLGRDVAVKVLSERYSRDPAFVERFRREAQAAAGLNHPNIVSVYDRGEAEGSYFIVMEYVSGPDLKRVIRDRAPFAPLEAVDATLQILAALQAAHRRNVVHRDVKPQNVMLAEDGRLKVTDFGIARAGDADQMTEVGQVIGTAQYLSPEQARGEEVTGASDCYSAGIVLYEMLTGRVPFDGDRSVAVAVKQINELPVPPQDTQPGIPDALNAVVMRALQKRPEDRFASADELSHALLAARAELVAARSTQMFPVAGDGAGATQTIAAAGAPAPPTARAPARRRRTGAGAPSAAPPPRRRWPTITAVLVLLAAVGVAVGFLLGRGASGHRVKVPDVTNLTQAAAQQLLTSDGLHYQVVDIPSATVTSGRVVDTLPGANVEVSTSDTLLLRVSTGPAMVDVPDVTGKDLAAATAALTAKGLGATVTHAFNPTVAKGSVISQDQLAGTSVATGTKVGIVVSDGPELVTVPEVRLEPLDQATADLKSRGLAVGSVTIRLTDRRDPNLVLAQSLRGGSRQPKGSSVDLVIAAREVQVPDVVGQDATSAKAQLEALGLTVVSQAMAPQNGEQIGTVIQQNPAANATTTTDKPVTIYVSTPTGASPSPGGGDGQ